MKLQNITAAELKRYNANNRGTNTSDCVNRSISMAFGKDYVEVHRDLVASMKKKNWGSWKSPIVYGDVIQMYGGSKFTAPNIDPMTGEVHEDYTPKTLKDFIDTYAPTGVYLIETGHKPPKYAPGKFSHGGDHIVCVIDGVIYDSWDSSGEYVYNYVTVHGRKALELSGIENQIADIGMATRSIILEEAAKQASKYGFEDGKIEIGKPAANGSFGFKIPVRFQIERFEDFFTFTFKLAYVFTPETTYEQAKKKVHEVTKIRIYDRFYEINKKLKEKEEGYKLWKESGLENPYNEDWIWDGNDKRFYNSLPGWVRPFIKYLNVQQPGQYSDSYTLTFRPIPGDPRQDERVRLEAYDSATIKQMLEWYKKDFSRPWDDYDPHEEF